MSQHYQALQAHENLLAERVFQIDTKWPQFRLLLDDVKQLAAQLNEQTTVVSLERGLLYGGCSLIAPFFHTQRFLSIDCSPESANERGGYNQSMVDDARFIKVPTHRRAHICQTGLEANIADLLLVPNLVHHVADQHALFSEIERLVKPNGQVYIFEPLIRELHQEPDDYLRYTPYGLKRTLAAHGFETADIHHTGNAFSAIAYCWTQALEYFPEDKRKEMSEWFYQTHFPQLMQWDTEYPQNLSRQHTSFPTAFSIRAVKTATPER